MIDQIFLLKIVKRNVIISNRHGTYELPHKLLEHLRLRILRNNYSLVNSLPPEIKILLILAKLSLKIEIELFP